MEKDAFSQLPFILNNWRLVIKSEHAGISEEHLNKFI